VLALGRPARDRDVLVGLELDVDPAVGDRDGRLADRLVA
jgi:hypothetical protein